MRYLLYEVFIGICPTVLSDEASACPSGFPGLLNQPPPVRHEHNTTHPFIICDALLIQYVKLSRFLNRQNEDGYQSRLILLSKMCSWQQGCIIHPSLPGASYTPEGMFILLATKLGPKFQASFTRRVLAPAAPQMA